MRWVCQSMTAVRARITMVTATPTAPTLGRARTVTAAPITASAMARRSVVGGDAVNSGTGTPHVRPRACQLLQQGHRFGVKRVVGFDTVVGIGDGCRKLLEHSVHPGDASRRVGGAHEKPVEPLLAREDPQTLSCCP